MEPQPIGVAIILFNSTQNAILLGKRLNSYKAGFYGLPGGRAELSESLVDAATRELREETGLEAQKLNYVGTIRERQDGYTFIHFIYSSSEYTGQLQLMEPDKCEGWEWVSLEDLPDSILPGHQAGVELYLNPDEARIRDLL